LGDFPPPWLKEEGRAWGIKKNGTKSAKEHSLPRHRANTRKRGSGKTCAAANEEGRGSWERDKNAVPNSGPVTKKVPEKKKKHAWRGG